MCDQCFLLKTDIASKTWGAEQKVKAAMLYRDHLREQFQDRTTLWTFQALSGDDDGSDWGSDELTLLMDGMDQGKFMTPRDPLLRSTASLCALLCFNLAPSMSVFSLVLVHMDVFQQ